MYSSLAGEVVTKEDSKTAEKMEESEKEQTKVTAVREQEPGPEIIRDMLYEPHKSLANNILYCFYTKKQKKAL